MNERKRVVSIDAAQIERAAVAPGKMKVGLARLLSERVLTPYLQVMTGRYLKLEPAGLNRLPGPCEGRGYTLYVHVPFCESLCPFCSFNRFLYEEEKAHTYFARLREEMRVELKRLQRENNQTFVYISPDEEEVLAISDRVAVVI